MDAMDTSSIISEELPASEAHPTDELLEVDSTDTDSAIDDIDQE